jgi:altronate dehydratase large subunit
MSAAIAPEQAMAEQVVTGVRGRRRPWGGTGIRDHLLVIPSVLCAAQAADVMTQHAPGAVSISHQHGCAQLGGDAHLTAEVLTGLGTHPNVAGALVVSLGCETVQGLLLHRAIREYGQRAEFVGIQQSGGTLAAIRDGEEALARLRDGASIDPDVPVSWPELTVGVETGWLSLPPGQAAVFARVIEYLIAEGTTVIQTVPLAVIEDHPDDCAEAAAVHQTLGPRPARVIPYAARTAEHGTLSLMPAPATRIAQKTGLAAAGAHVILSPFADGLPAGCPVAPVVHVGILPYALAFGRDVEVMLDDDPGPEAAERVRSALLSACRAETMTELLGTFEMGIYRIGPTM